MAKQIGRIVEEIQQKIVIKSGAAVNEYLNQYFNAFASRFHLKNIADDLEFLKNMSPPPKRILDFGCGIGLQSYLMGYMGYEVVGLETIDDKSPQGFFKSDAEPYLRTRESGITNVWEIIARESAATFKFYDGKDIPFNDDNFDIVFTYAVIEHIPPDEVPHIMKELNRVMKKGGLLYIFQLPQRSSYSEFIARKLRLQSHQYLWSRDEIKKILKKYGFALTYSGKNDMVIHQPQRLINIFYPVLEIVNRVLLTTPLSYFAHHLTIVGAKD